MLRAVRFEDTKALGGPPIFTIEFLFRDQPPVTVTCNDDTAATRLSTMDREYELNGGDFYCFHLDSIVRDLSDVTDGYVMPSFADDAPAEAEFLVTDDIEIPFLLGDTEASLEFRLEDRMLVFSALDE